MSRSRTLDAVISDLEAREAQGLVTYGCTVDRVDLTRTDWVRHAYHEALDLAMYLRRVQMEGINDGGNRDTDGAGNPDHIGRHGGGNPGSADGATVSVPATLMRLGSATSIWMAMASLANEDGVITASWSQIGTMTDLSLATVARVIDQLIRTGHVERLDGQYRNSMSRYRLIV